MTSSSSEADTTTTTTATSTSDKKNNLTWLNSESAKIVPPEGALWRLFALAEKWRLHDLAVAEITSPPPPPRTTAAAARASGARGSGAAAASSANGGGGSSDRSLALLAALLDLVTVSPRSSLSELAASGSSSGVVADEASAAEPVQKEAAVPSPPLELPPVVAHLLQRFGVREALAADWASFVANHTATQVRTALDDPASPAYEAKRMLALLGSASVGAEAAGTADTAAAATPTAADSAKETAAESTSSSSAAAQLAAALQAPNATEPKVAADVLTKLVNLLLQPQGNKTTTTYENNENRTDENLLDSASLENNADLECGSAETHGKGLTHHEFCAHAPGSGGGSGGSSGNANKLNGTSHLLNSPDLLSALLAWVERADAPLRHTLLEHLLASSSKLSSSSSQSPASNLEATALVALVQKLQVVCALEASHLPSFSHKSSGSDLVESASKVIGLNLKFHPSELTASTGGAAAESSTSSESPENTPSSTSATTATLTSKSSKKSTANSSAPRSAAAVRATRTSKVSDVAAQVLRTIPAHQLPPSYTQACRLLVGTRVRERPARAFARKGNPPSNKSSGSGSGSGGGGGSSSGSGSSRSGGSSSKGRNRSGSDGDWREAMVFAYDESAGAHQLVYLDDDDFESNYNNHHSDSDLSGGNAATAAAAGSTNAKTSPGSSSGKRHRHRRPHKRHGASSSHSGVWMRLALRDVEPLERVKPPQPDPKAPPSPKESPAESPPSSPKPAASSQADGAGASSGDAEGEFKEEITGTASEEKTAEGDIVAANKEENDDGSGALLNAGNACTVEMTSASTAVVSGAHLAQGRANGIYRPLTLPGYRGCPPWAKVGDSRIAMLR